MATHGRVLIADDEEIFLLSTADLLRQEGYEVDCAKDACEADRLLQNYPYDVLISDIRMPGNPDLALIRGLPAPNRGLPVILLTGYPSAPTAIEAINLSVLAYLLKPIDFENLLQKVREGVQSRMIRRTMAESSKRIQAWAAELGGLADEISRPGVSDAVSVSQMLGLALGRMGETLMDLKHLVDVAAPNKDSDICPIKSCPRLDAYGRVVQEAIETLERTKGAFKSKELGDLRMKLERTIKGDLTLGAASPL